MTVTSSTSTWNSYVNKDNDLQAALVAPKGVGGVKFYRCDVTFGASDNYVTGGVTISADPNGQQADAYLIVIPENITGLTAPNYLIPYYNRATGKLQLFTAAASSASNVALTELVNGSTLTNSIVVTLLVIEV